MVYLITCASSLFTDRDVVVAVPLPLQELMSEKTKAAETPLAALLDEALRFCRVQDQLYARAVGEVGMQHKLKQAEAARCGFMIAFIPVCACY